jgi:AraC family transcriptional regulator
LAKIAVALERALAGRAVGGGPGCTTARILAKGNGWTVADVVCTSGPHDRPFEEQHSQTSIAIVAAGTFQYRSTAGRDLMAPGSLLLGNAGDFFECGHEHGAGDRCLSFWYAPEYFESLAADAGIRGTRPALRMQRLPPLRALSPLVARACAGLAAGTDVAWEELGLRLATLTVQLAADVRPRPSPPPAAVARVTRSVRAIERHPDAPLALRSLAREAGLSPYHFLRTFERLTGVTPHQYVLRARLRQAALLLTAEPARILEIALECGFGDLSNFNRTFRAEFGVNPRAYRQAGGVRP